MIWGIKTYIIAYVKTQKIRYIIHYVKVILSRCNIGIRISLRTTDWEYNTLPEWLLVLIERMTSHHWCLIVLINPGKLLFWSAFEDDIAMQIH